MILEMERLILRRYTADDLNDLYEYLSDDEVVKFEPYKAMSIEETRDNLKWRIGTDEMGNLFGRTLIFMENYSNIKSLYRQSRQI